MPWLYTGRVIREGHGWTDSDGVQHPRNWGIWSDEEKTDRGMVWQDEPASFDSRYYWDADTAKSFGLIDSDVGGGFTVSSEFALSPFGQTTELTALIDSGATPQAFRVGVNQIVSLYTTSGMNAGELSNFYPTIATLLSANSFTLDDSASSDSAGPDMSLTLETMDNDMFTRYTSDSTI